MRRFRLAIGMNLLVPGTGLIALGRVWLGIALAVWFAAGAELAACGLLVAPMSIPHWISLTAAGLAAAAWIAAQGLLLARIRFLRDPNLPAELGALRNLAEAAMQRGDLAAAQSSLRVALSIDESDLPARILWARLLSAKGRHVRARQAWREAEDLDTDKSFAAEIRQGLDQL